MMDDNLQYDIDSINVSSNNKNITFDILQNNIKI